jgi:MFS family permease
VKHEQRTKTITVALAINTSRPFPESSRGFPHTRSHDEEKETSRRSKPNPFHVLRHPNFRHLWLGLAVSSTGSWMQVVTQSLLVLELSNGSPVALGAVSLAQAASFLMFSLIGGALADRFDRRRLLLVTQSVSMLLSALLGVLVLLELVSVPVLVLFAFCSGVTLSFDQPTRAALLPALVPKDELPRASALQTLLLNSTATLGPILAGWTVDASGLAAPFLLNALSFAGVLIAMATMGVPSQPAKKATPLLESVRQGLNVVRHDRALPIVFILYGALLLLGPSPSLLLPLYGAEILNLSGTELGALFTAVGTGTMLGALLNATYGQSKGLGNLLLAGILVWSLALLTFALSPHFMLSLLALFVLGLSRNVVGMSATTLMQLRAPDAARGRVMSLNTLLLNGSRPLGDFLLSMMMTALPLAVVVAGSAVLVGGLGTFLSRTSVRQQLRD